MMLTSIKRFTLKKGKHHTFDQNPLETVWLNNCSKQCSGSGLFWTLEINVENKMIE